MLRGTFLELKALHRLPGLWLPLALGVWILLIWVQEPAFMRRTGTPFFWESVEAAMSLCFALVPLAWLLARSPTQLVLRATRYPIRTVSISTLSIVIYGIEIAIWAGLLGWSLDQLNGVSSAGEAWTCGIGALVLLAPLASLAPGLAFLCRSAQGATVSWLAIAGAYALLLDNGSATGAGAFVMSEILSATLATAAGLLLSAAVVCRRIST